MPPKKRKPTIKALYREARLKELEALSAKRDLVLGMTIPRSSCLSRASRPSPCAIGSTAT